MSGMMVISDDFCVVVVEGVEKATRRCGVRAQLWAYWPGRVGVVKNGELTVERRKRTAVHSLPNLQLICVDHMHKSHLRDEPFDGTVH